MFPFFGPFSEDSIAIGTEPLNEQTGDFATLSFYNLHDFQLQWRLTKLGSELTISPYSILTNMMRSQPSNPFQCSFHHPLLSFLVRIRRVNILLYPEVLKQYDQIWSNIETFELNRKIMFVL